MQKDFFRNIPTWVNYRTFIFILVFAFLLVPGYRQSAFSGIPFVKPFELVVILSFLLLLFGLPWKDAKWNGWKRGTIGLGVLLFIKILCSLLSSPHGLTAQYATDSALGLSGSIGHYEYRGLETTNAIDFNYGATSFLHETFPLGFLNNRTVFNFISGSGQPERRLLSWSATYVGILYIQEEGPVSYYLESSGPAIVTIDGKVELTTLDTQGYKIGSSGLSLSPGEHPIVITFIHTSLSRPLLIFSWARAGQNMEPVSARAFSPFPLSKEDRLKDAIGARVGKMVIILGIILILILLWRAVEFKGWQRLAGSRRFQLVMIATLGFVVLSFQLWVYGLEHDFRLLDGGNDPLVYESNARYMLSTGDWALRGPEKGAYYYNVLYQYLLAVGHAAFGEDLLPIAVFQVFSLVLLALVSGSVMKQIFGRWERETLIILLGSGLFFQYTYQFFPIGALPLMTSILLALKYPRMLRGAVGSGALLGVALLLRTNFATALPVFLLWFFIYASGWKRIAIPLLFLLSALIIILPATIRNYRISGELVLINKNFENNFVNGNPIPPSVDLTRIDTDPFYKILPLSQGTRRVAEFLRQDPTSFLALQWKKFTLFFGVFDTFKVWSILLPPLFMIGIFIWMLFFRRVFLRIAWMPITITLLLTIGIILTIISSSRYLLPMLSVFLLFTTASVGFMVSKIPSTLWLKICAAATVSLLFIHIGIVPWFAIPATLLLLRNRQLDSV